MQNICYPHIIFCKGAFVFFIFDKWRIQNGEKHKNHYKDICVRV